MIRQPSATLWVAAALALSAVISVRSEPQEAPTTPAAVAQPARSPAVTATTAFQGDVHAGAGLTCESCHTSASRGAGGDAVYAAIPRTSIPALCATCHADAAYMRRFAPQVRVDQFAQYQTSVHGQQLATGETRVATCSDCHGAHGVLPVRDARSPVAPAHVAQTCARCHSDPDRMTPFGRSAEVVDDWTGSIHAAALLVRGDTSAPTCSTCHGSHGATPPGIDTVVNVCAQCHVREAELFGGSVKKDLFDVMGLADCLVCHGNHRIERPDQTWIGTKDPAVCAMCHDDTTPSGETIGALRSGFDTLLQRTDEARARVTQAERAGMLVDDGALALHDAVEAHVQLRVSLHSFSHEPFDDVLAEGLSAAARAEQIGSSALDELGFRRRGLLVATLFILGFLVTLFVRIRSLPPVDP